jgi:hypothetical protein
LRETISIIVDYESPLARRVAGDLWSSLSRAALEAGHTRMVALWESLASPGSPANSAGPSAHVFVVGQDRPEAVDRIGEIAAAFKPSRLYGVVVAVPERPSPLSGSLLYQGVEAATRAGVRAGDVLPALVPVLPLTECEAYTARLFERLQKV